MGTEPPRAARAHRGPHAPARLQRPEGDARADGRGDRRRADANPEAVAGLRAEYELVRTAFFGDPPKKMPLPCYFNTGCCSYGDGDVTGIEISGGMIRLVRWLDDEAAPKAKQLAEEPLRDVLHAVEGSHL